MIKLLAETKGSFQLLDLSYKGQLLRANRPCVIENSNFIQDRIGRAQIRVHGELKDEATDADFIAYLAEAKGDMPLAIDSFLAEFGKEAVEKPKKRRGKKVAETDETDETDENGAGE
ncbi:hypothetical protein [Mesorhizobium sp. WSM2239]|uniref:Uncharacterized protein n=2 Tax=unclassified Mesorhizobium TaxID=325217 RepID=A0AAU8DEA4_9HYPH